MVRRTLSFIEELKNLSGINEIIERVTVESELLKATLHELGYKVNTANHDYLAEGQGILNKDVGFIEYYREFTHIKRGIITGEWVSVIDEQKRFDEIRNVIQDILET